MNMLQHIQTSRRGPRSQKSASNSRYCHILALVPTVVIALIKGRLYVLTYVAQASRAWLSTSFKSSFVALGLFDSMKMRTDGSFRPSSLTARSTRRLGSAIHQRQLEISSPQRYIWRVTPTKNFWMPTLRWPGFGPLFRDPSRSRPKLETLGLMSIYLKYYAPIERTKSAVGEEDKGDM